MLSIAEHLNTIERYGLRWTSYGKTSGIGYDIGLLFPLKKLRFGMGVYDLGGKMSPTNKIK